MDAEEADRTLEAPWDGVAGVYEEQRARIFGPRAEELVRRAGIQEDARVLDIGTGTGIAALRAAREVGPEGYVLGVDTAEGLLEVARKKAESEAPGHVEFRRMSMAELDLPDASFDHVIGNYSLCCSARYEEALREAHRVLRPGGRLTYNHEGPHPPALIPLFNDVLAKHKVAEPSEATRRIREANAFVEERWQDVREPFRALEEMEVAGFRACEVFLTFERQAHPTLEAYLDYKLQGSVEVAEMGEAAARQLRRELADALRPHLTSEGVTLRMEVVVVTGVK